MKNLLDARWDPMKEEPPLKRGDRVRIVVDGHSVTAVVDTVICDFERHEPTGRSKKPKLLQKIHGIETANPYRYFKIIDIKKSGSVVKL